MPDNTPTEQGERVERWTLYVCDGCGAVETVNGLDQWGQCIVHHGESTDSSQCIRPASAVEVIPLSALQAEREKMLRLADELVNTKSVATSRDPDFYRGERIRSEIEEG